LYPEDSSACTKVSDVNLDREGDPDNDFTPIILVDRGNCSFIRKARNVQEMGGALALIVNTADESDPERIIMIDDGTGISVTIPTLLIKKSDGALIKQAIIETEQNNKDVSRANEYVVLLIDFAMVSLVLSNSLIQMIE